jgi:hypothetical protein
MTWAVFGQLKALFDQMMVMLGQLIVHAKEWQPLLAGLLVLVASIILAAGIIKAAKIRAGVARDTRAKPAPAPPQSTEKAPPTHDLRTASLPRSLDTETLSSNLETLRSLLRSALSSLSSVDTDDNAARLLCARIASFHGPYVPLPGNVDKRIREAHTALLNQFETLRVTLDKEWSPSEASAILIQLNASARALTTVLKQTGSIESTTLGRQSKN